MQFRKYERFVKSYQYDKATGEIVVMVDCAYQKGQKALFEIGTLAEIRSLIAHLTKVKNFAIEAENSQQL